MGGLDGRRHDARPGSSTSTVEARQADDWLGEISDDDWSEPAGRRLERGRHGADDDLADPADGRGSEPAGERSQPARTVDAGGAVQRRRTVALLVLATVLVGAAVGAVLVAREGETAPGASVSEPGTTTPEQTATGTSSTPTTTTPSDTSTAPDTTASPDDSTPPTTTPSTPGTASFTLPEGTKLRLGEDADPEVVTELQQALTSAGFDPGPIDGTYGPQTERAVVAFQQANDLSDDGVVGPATAAALNEALAAG